MQIYSLWKLIYKQKIHVIKIKEFYSNVNKKHTLKVKVSAGSGCSELTKLDIYWASSFTKEILKSVL